MSIVPIPFSAWFCVHLPDRRAAITNDHQRGLAIIDIAGDIETIAFPDGVEIIIEALAVRHDGRAAMAFLQEDPRACYFDLAARTSHWLVGPPFEILSTPAYDWRTDTLWVQDRASSRYAVSRGGADFEPVGVEVALHNRSFRRATRKLSAGRYCMNSASDTGILTYGVGDPVRSVGVVSLVDDHDEFEIPCRAKLGRLSGSASHILVGEEYVVTLYDRTGAVVARLEAPPGTHFCAMDLDPTNVAILANATILAGGQTGMMIFG